MHVRAREGRKGQSLVEFSMAIPILFLIIYGIFEFALAIHTEIDFNSADAAGIRTATIDGDGSTLQGSLQYIGVDSQIAASVLTGLRSDDRGRGIINWFSVQGVDGRNLPCAATPCSGITDVYKNTYSFNAATQSFNTQVQLPAGADWCHYFYEAHTDTASGINYLDASQAIAAQSGSPYYPDPPAGSPLCGRTTGQDLTCTTNGAVAGGNQRLCYYYPTERATSVDPNSLINEPLPDEEEVDLNYTYRPIVAFIASQTPLGHLLNITEHVQGRIEPTSIAQSQ
jgi:hypothetical protein